MSKTFVIDLVDASGKPLLDVPDVGALEPGDEVEWKKGNLDVTIAFAGSQIFGATEFRLPPGVASKRATVQTPPASPEESYTITDEGSGQTFRRQGEPRSHPVMIFGP